MPVLADGGMLGQVLMNLAVNARDAMPHGGALVLRTANVEFPARSSDCPGMPPGRYAVLEVQDTGEGMSDEVKAHLFEPFFTTKGPGRGTGLGLATVYGIVKQSGGYVYAQSERGVGTTFRVYLPPAVNSSISADDSSHRNGAAPRGIGTILVAEDEASVRTLICRTLRENGYEVLEAENGLEALRVWEQYPGTVDLLLTDVIMPQVGGGELARRMTERVAGLRVLYVSGHADDARVQQGVAGSGAHFLAKPFLPDELLCRVAEVLGTRKQAIAHH
jgi:CheY-like chemotaxis protein